MDTQGLSRTEAAEPVAPNTPTMHNPSVDEDAAGEGLCAQLHLPSGRMCTMPHAHEGSCEFSSAEDAQAAVADHRADAGR